VARIAKQKKRPPAHSKWDAVVVPVALLILLASCYVATTFAGSVLDPQAHWSEWEVVLLLWVVSVPVSLVAGLLLGRVVDENERRKRLSKSGWIWLVVFVLITVAASVTIALLPARPLEPAEGSVFEQMVGIATFLSGWTVGVPLGMAVGLWLAVRRLEGVVTKAPSGRGKAEG
jgi:Na+/proline symporter